MFGNILIIIGIILIILFIAFIYLCSYALCKISSEESRREEEFSIGFLERQEDNVNKKS